MTIDTKLLLFMDIMMLSLPAVVEMVSGFEYSTQRLFVWGEADTTRQSGCVGSKPAQDASNEVVNRRTRQGVRCEGMTC